MDDGSEMVFECHLSFSSERNQIGLRGMHVIEKLTCFKEDEDVLDTKLSSALLDGQNGLIANNREVTCT